MLMIFSGNATLKHEKKYPFVDFQFQHTMLRSTINYPPSFFVKQILYLGCQLTFLRYLSPLLVPLFQSSLLLSFVFPSIVDYMCDWGSAYATWSTRFWLFSIVCLVNVQPFFTLKPLTSLIETAVWTIARI